MAATHAEIELESNESTTPLSVLHALVQGPYDSELRGRALATIAKRFPSKTEFLRAALYDAAPEVREAAAAALAEKGLRVETGGLTLADAEGGELSLSREEGELSPVSPTQEGKVARRL